MVRDLVLTKVFPKLPCANTFLIDINHFLGYDASWAKPHGISKFPTCSGEADGGRLNTVTYPCGEPKHVALIFMYYSSTYIYMVVRFQNQYICCMDMAMPSSQTLWGSGSSSPPVLSGLSSTQGESLRGWESGTSGTKASGKDLTLGLQKDQESSQWSMGKVSAQSGHGSVPVGLEPRRAEWSWYWTVANCSNPRVTQQFQEV